MSVAGQQPAAPASAAEAVAVLEGALGYLARADPGSLTMAEQAAVLRGLERAEARQTAARARVLSAFVSGGGLAADGHCSARGWLIWQARVTRGAAGGAVGWMRRLARHPAVADALAAGEISASWARQLSDWTDLLPGHLRGKGDSVLLASAAAGVDLDGLALLAREMRECAARPDADGDGGFTDRSVRLDATFEGAGKLNGDLTPQCTAALAAVLESLGKRAGPEDLRSRDQRDHDALEEACRRLIAAGGLPDVAGQPVQIQLQMTLGQLRGLDGAANAEAGWTAGRAPGAGEPGWPAGRAAAEGYSCDAQITPMVSGHLDPVVLAAMTRAFLAGQARPGWAQPSGTLPPATMPPLRDTPLQDTPLRDTLLRYAADLLSGPAGLAAILRTGLPGPQAAAVSLPLDVGTATSTIPPHLRRAVIARDRHCAFPGCGQRPAACQVHHIVPRARGGATSLANCLLLCTFHHLIAIHRWGWTITLHADGTTTATSPDATRTLHGHGPPLAA